MREVDNEVLKEDAICWICLMVWRLVDISLSSRFPYFVHTLEQYTVLSLSHYLFPFFFALPPQSKTTAMHVAQGFRGFMQDCRAVGSLSVFSCLRGCITHVFQCMYLHALSKAIYISVTYLLDRLPCPFRILRSRSPGSAFDSLLSYPAMLEPW